jgi:hypothetical protein
MRTVATVLASLAAVVGLTACSPGTITAEDAYKIGCPAVDTAAGGGTLMNKATVAGLKELSRSGALDPEPQRWLDATIGLLESDNPNAVSSEAKQLVVDGCADNGYPLRNLK